MYVCIYVSTHTQLAARRTDKRKEIKKRNLKASMYIYIHAHTAGGKKDTLAIAGVSSKIVSRSVLFLSLAVLFLSLSVLFLSLSVSVSVCVSACLSVSCLRPALSSCVFSFFLSRTAALHVVSVSDTLCARGCARITCMCIM